MYWYQSTTALGHHSFETFRQHSNVSLMKQKETIIACIDYQTLPLASLHFLIL